MVSVFQVIYFLDCLLVCDVTSHAVLGICGIDDNSAIFKNLRYLSDEAKLRVFCVDGYQHNLVRRNETFRKPLLNLKEKPIHVNRFSSFNPVVCKRSSKFTIVKRRGICYLFESKKHTGEITWFQR